MSIQMCQSCIAGEVFDVEAEYSVKAHQFKFVCDDHAEILLEDGEIKETQLKML